jgi:NADP-dependent 3-hydroxy acid dehydrogenase YdfG
MAGQPKTWLITGCSSGFGEAIAEAALSRGDRVMLTARDVSSLEALAGK